MTEMTINKFVHELIQLLDLVTMHGLKVLIQTSFLSLAIHSLLHLTRLSGPHTEKKMGGEEGVAVSCIVSLHSNPQLSIDNNIMFLESLMYYVVLLGRA